MPSKMPSKRPAFMLSVTAESNDSSPVPSSPPSTGPFYLLFKNSSQLIYVFWIWWSLKRGQYKPNALIFIYFLLGGESFEGFGENDTTDQVSGGGIDLVLAPHINTTQNNK